MVQPVFPSNSDFETDPGAILLIQTPPEIGHRLKCLFKRQILMAWSISKSQNESRLSKHHPEMDGLGSNKTLTNQQHTDIDTRNFTGYQHQQIPKKSTN